MRFLADESCDYAVVRARRFACSLLSTVGPVNTWSEVAPLPARLSFVHRQWRQERPSIRVKWVRLAVITSAP